MSGVFEPVGPVVLVDVHQLHDGLGGVPEHDPHQEGADAGDDHIEGHGPYPLLRAQHALPTTAATFAGILDTIGGVASAGGEEGVAIAAVTFSRVIGHFYVVSMQGGGSLWNCGAVLLE